VPDRLEAVVVDAGARFETEDVVRAQRALVESCERHTERIVLLDPPCAERPPSLAALRAWAARFSSSYAVAVAPWLTVVDPRAVGRVRRLPASGHLAGMIAQTDALDGPWRTPANRSLTWAHGVDVDFTAEEHAIANEDGILVVRALPGRGLVPMGGRTLSADALWVFLAVRRTMIYLRRALRLHLAWTVFEPNGPQLARTVESAVATLLEQTWEEGGLVGAKAEDAYALQVDQSRAATGHFVLVVGVALARPAEFVTARVSRTDNRLEVAEMPEVVVRAGVAS
jgi:phage tail sheath protein FI